MKQILLVVLALVIAAGTLVWVFLTRPDAIPDTNGEADFSLTTITDANIIAKDIGARNPLTTKQGGFEVAGISINNDVKLYSKNFTGVYDVFSTFMIGDFTLSLNYLKVESGNFKMVLVLNDEIVQVVEPSDETIYLELNDIKGNLSLRIAGESANYSFSMWPDDYEYYIGELDE